MAQIVWTEPALADLDAIADYIALENPGAARLLVQRVFQHVGQLSEFPESGPRPAELEGWRYRQIIEPPCRVLYRDDGDTVYILCVIRNERLLRPRMLAERARSAGPRPRKPPRK